MFRLGLPFGDRLSPIPWMVDGGSGVGWWMWDRDRLSVSWGSWMVDRDEMGIGKNWGSGTGDRVAYTFWKTASLQKSRELRKKKFFSVPEINCFVRISLPVTVNGNEDFSLMEAKKSFSFRSTRNSSWCIEKNQENPMVKFQLIFCNCVKKKGIVSKKKEPKMKVKFWPKTFLLTISKVNSLNYFKFCTSSGDSKNG